MDSIVRKVLIAGVVGLFALGAVAFAAADDSSVGDDDHDNAALQATAEPTETQEATDDAADDGEGNEADDIEDEGNSEVTRTAAMNHGGNCVELPDHSDVISNPEKHPNWTITDCTVLDNEEADDADEAKDADEDDDDEAEDHDDADDDDDEPDDDEEADDEDGEEESD